MVGKVWKEGVRGETGIRGHLESNIENKCSENSQESTRVISARTPTIEATEPDPSLFCNHGRLLVVVLGHQHSHTTFDLQYVLPSRCAETMVTQNKWKVYFNVYSSRESIYDTSLMIKNQITATWHSNSPMRKLRMQRMLNISEYVFWSLARILTNKNAKSSF